MKVPVPTLSPVLRSDTQGRILARVFADPEQSHSLTALMEWSEASMPTVIREVRRAEQAGIVETWKDGNVRRVRALTRHPLYRSMSQIVLSAYGPPIVVAEEFEGISGADAVVLFGSWAARHAGHAGRMPNDIDVLVIGNPDRDAVDHAAARVERRLSFPTQAVVRTRGQWESNEESFIKEVKHRPLHVILVGEAADDLFQPPDDAAAGEL